MTCYSVEDHRFWAYTWKQKLFSMSQGSTWAFDIWLVTYDMQQCDMRDVKVFNMWNVTCDSVEDHRFWAYTWKQKLFSMSQGSTWAFDIWLVTYDMQQCDMRDVKVWETVTFFAYSWRTMMFSMSQGSTKRVTCGMWQPDELPHENKSCWVCQKQHLAFGIFQRDKRRCQKTSIALSFSPMNCEFLV